MHGGKPRVACAYRIASAVFEVLQEFLDQRHVEVLDSELGRRAPDMLSGERQQQPERVTVTCHRMRTQTLLLEQALGEEALNQGWEAGGAHGRSPGQSLSR